jgi:hypothetical protein
MSNLVDKLLWIPCIAGAVVAAVFYINVREKNRLEAQLKNDVVSRCLALADARADAELLSGSNDETVMGDGISDLASDPKGTPYYFLKYVFDEKELELISVFAVSKDCKWLVIDSKSPDWESWRAKFAVVRKQLLIMRGSVTSVSTGLPTHGRPVLLFHIKCKHEQLS